MTDLQKHIKSKVNWKFYNFLEDCAQEYIDKGIVRISAFFIKSEIYTYPFLVCSSDKSIADGDTDIDGYISYTMDIFSDYEDDYENTLRDIGNKILNRCSGKFEISYHCEFVNCEKDLCYKIILL